MFRPKLIGVYVGVPCGTKVMTQDFSEAIVFPLLIQLDCPTCGSYHRFRYSSKYLAQTAKEWEKIHLAARHQGILSFILPRE